jgi:hypothetical protein
MVLGGLLTLSLVANGFADTTNVYSKNAVGYIQKQVSADVYYLVSCPLVMKSSGPVLPSDVFGNTVFADATSLYIFDRVTQEYISEAYLDGVGWYPGTTDLSRGKGFWFTSPVTTNLSFIGEVPGVTTTSTNLVPGFQLVAYPYPATVLITDTALQSIVVDSDSVWKWNPSTSEYISYAYLNEIGWIPEVPTLSPGDGFWFQRLGSSTSWTETKPYTFP